MHSERQDNRIELMDNTATEQPEILETPAVGPEPEVDETAEALKDAHLSDDARRMRWQSRRPPILHLKSGVVQHFDERDPVTKLLPVEKLPLFDVGDRIVVDVCTKLLRPWLNKYGEVVYPWLHTIVGKVRSIDDETGLVTMYDEDSDMRAPTVRYVNFKDDLHDFRLAPAKGNPFNVVAAAKPIKPPPAPGEVRRGRGRPKGSKNRSKEEIQAEREAYKKMREERKKGKR